MAAPYLVFVYGTLKRGEPNHHVMFEGEGKADFVGTGKTKAKYPLTIASRFNIPFLMDVKGLGHQIKGEVYRVDDERLKQLDILEDYPRLYTRRREEIIMDPAEGIPTNLEAIVYFLIKHKPQMLEQELLESYSSKGPHGKEYSVKYADSDSSAKDEIWAHDDLSDPDDIDF